MPKFLLKDIGQIERVGKFKYLGKIIQENCVEQSATEERTHETEKAYGITKDNYNKKVHIWKCENEALQYSRVADIYCICATECLVLNYKLDKLKMLKRRITKKRLGPLKTSEG